MLRLGWHQDTVYLQEGEEPSVNDERVAVFMGTDANYYASAFIYAMSLVRHDCNCNVICPQCGKLTGENAERECEYCREHRGECEEKAKEQEGKARMAIIRSYDRTNVQTPVTEL